MGISPSTVFSILRSTYLSKSWLTKKTLVLSIYYRTLFPTTLSKGCYKWMSLSASLRPAQGFLLPWCCSPARCVQRSRGVCPRSTDVAVSFLLTDSTSSEAQLCSILRTPMNFSTDSQDVFLLFWSGLKFTIKSMPPPTPSKCTNTWALVDPSVSAQYILLSIQYPSTWVHSSCAPLMGLLLAGWQQVTSRQMHTHTHSQAPARAL